MGNLADEMKRLTDVLVAVRVSAREAMTMHLRVVESMVRELGSRSARHVMSRADLLILELIINLADRYRVGSHDGPVEPRSTKTLSRPSSADLER